MSDWGSGQTQSFTGQPDMKRLRAGLGATLPGNTAQKRTARPGSIRIGSAAKKAAAATLQKQLNPHRTQPPNMQGVDTTPATLLLPPPAADSAPQRPPPPPPPPPAAKPAMTTRNERTTSAILKETMAGKIAALREVYKQAGYNPDDEYLKYYIKELDSDPSPVMDSGGNTLQMIDGQYILTQDPAVEQSPTDEPTPIQQEALGAATQQVIKRPSIKVEPTPVKAEPASGSRNITGEKADKKLKKAAHDELKKLKNYGKQKDAIKLKLRTKFGYKSGSAEEQTHWNIVQEKLVESMNSTDIGAEIRFTLTLKAMSYSAIASVYGDNMVFNFEDGAEESKTILRDIVGKKNYESGYKIIMNTVLAAFSMPQKEKLFKKPFWPIIKQKLLESFKTNNNTPITFELNQESGTPETFTAQVTTDRHMIVKPATTAKETEVKKYAKRTVKVIEPITYYLPTTDVQRGITLGRLLLCEPNEFKAYDADSEYKFDGYSKHSGLVNSWKSHVAGNKPFFRRYILFWRKSTNSLALFEKLFNANPKLALRFCIMFLNACSAPKLTDADNSKFFNHLLNNDMDFLDKVCQDILSFLNKEEILADKFGLFATREFTYLPDKYNNQKEDRDKVKKYKYFTVTVGAKFESLDIKFNSGIISRFDEARYHYRYIGSSTHKTKTKRAANPGFFARITKKKKHTNAGSDNTTEA